MLTNTDEFRELLRDTSDSPHVRELLAPVGFADPVAARARLQRIAGDEDGRVMLAPGGTHLMFNGVTRPFALGETIPVQLTFEHAGVVSAELPVSRSAPEHGR